MSLTREEYSAKPPPLKVGAIIPDDDHHHSPTDLPAEGKRTDDDIADVSTTSGNDSHPTTSSRGTTRQHVPPPRGKRFHIPMAGVVVVVAILVHLQVITVLQVRSIRHDLAEIQRSVRDLQDDLSELGAADGKEEEGKKRAGVLKQLSNLFGKKVQVIDVGDDDEEEEGFTGIATVEGNITTEKDGDDEFCTPPDLTRAWGRLVRNFTTGFQQTGIESDAVVIEPYTLDEYMSTFIDDQAPYSVERYQREVIGDMELETSPWKPLSKDDAFTRSRVMKYIHKVSNPMAPPTAKAEKHQRLRRYGKHGLVLDTTTIVKDVPKTDCFVVEDRIMVESVSMKKGGASVRVSARFEVRFTKKTMFRAIIERTTSGEFRSWFEQYGEMVKNVTGVGEQRLASSLTTTPQ